MVLPELSKIVKMGLAV